jgi:hypothetical protein
MHASAIAEPQLAPPGAGIPATERIIGGLIFALRRWRGSAERFSAEFVGERKAIASLYRSRSDVALAKRVLIPRLRGLEDSSRFWSVLMTLDHLRIVNIQITDVIAKLKRGATPTGVASTAAVKPSAEVDASVVPLYEASCDELLAVVSGGENLRTGVRFAHPWFGPLDGHGWHLMAAAHMGIHRAQIEKILRAGELR